MTQETDRSPLPLAERHVLVVDDNAVNQQVARNILQRAGAKVVVASSGAAALKAVERQPGLFHAVLMDIQMPDMDGYETTRLIRNRLGLATLPIIALSAHVGQQDRETALQAGMNGCLAKPIDPAALVAAVAGQAATIRPQEPAAEPLPQLPGIDLRTALIRLGGDQRLWLSLMHQFEGTQGAAIAETRHLLAAGMIREAAGALHRLRGVAANLGATELARLATDTEAAVKDGHESTLPGLLDRLQDAMATVFEAARRLPPPERKAAPPAASETLLPSLMELRHLLGTHNLKALARFEALRPAISAALPGEQPDALANALAMLDFAHAEKIVLNIVEAITRGAQA